MKTTKFLLTSLMMVLVLTLSATRTTEPVKVESQKEGSTRCPVELGEMQEYLMTCSHQHTVYWIQYISGTCNGLAGIEGSQTATVYVANGIITGHTDSGS